MTQRVLWAQRNFLPSIRRIIVFRECVLLHPFGSGFPWIVQNLGVFAYDWNNFFKRRFNWQRKQGTFRSNKPSRTTSSPPPYLFFLKKLKELIFASVIVLLRATITGWQGSHYFPRSRISGLLGRQAKRVPPTSPSTPFTVCLWDICIYYFINELISYIGFMVLHHGPTSCPFSRSLSIRWYPIKSFLPYQAQQYPFTGKMSQQIAKGFISGRRTSNNALRELQ